MRPKRLGFSLLLWVTTTLFVLQCCQTTIHAKQQQQQLRRKLVESSCGDGICSAGEEETCKTCPIDCCTLGGATAAATKVILLFGQSNMQGFGTIHHLDALIDGTQNGRSLCETIGNCPDPDLPTYFGKYQNTTTGTWKSRRDVYIKYSSHSGAAIYDALHRIRQGPLTVGYGKDDTMFGPELCFGWTLADYLLSNSTQQENVFLIKIARGGMSLAGDFRPPTSRATTPPESITEPSNGFGWAYDELVAHVQQQLQSIDSILPSDMYDTKRGYELTGAVFFQGWNDLALSSAADSPYVAEYKSNLANLVQDLRSDLGVADLAFVIGELGQQGTDLSGHTVAQRARIQGIRSAQQSVADTLDKVALATTKEYAYYPGEDARQGYHYYRNADTFCYMGESMANAMISLL